MPAPICGMLAPDPGNARPDLRNARPDPRNARPDSCVSDPLPGARSPDLRNRVPKLRARSPRCRSGAPESRVGTPFPWLSAPHFRARSPWLWCSVLPLRVGAPYLRVCAQVFRATSRGVLSSSRGFRTGAVRKAWRSARTSACCARIGAPRRTRSRSPSRNSSPSRAPREPQLLGGYGAVPRPTRTRRKFIRFSYGSARRPRIARAARGHLRARGRRGARLWSADVSLCAAPSRVVSRIAAQPGPSASPPRACS